MTIGSPYPLSGSWPIWICVLAVLDLGGHREIGHEVLAFVATLDMPELDRKSTRLNSSHVSISYTLPLSLHDALPISLTAFVSVSYLMVPSTALDYKHDYRQPIPVVR